VTAIRFEVDPALKFRVQIFEQEFPEFGGREQIRIAERENGGHLGGHREVMAAPIQGLPLFGPAALDNVQPA
jgi:hypothetical protein